MAGRNSWFPGITGEKSIAMDIKDIRKIIELMKQNELSEFELQDEGFRISIKRRNGSESNVVVTSQGVGVPAQPHMLIHPPLSASAPPIQVAAASADVEDESRTIKSPMVGTFYRASSPDTEPFATVGSEIEEDTIVCIIEAMKVMNEIKSETRGVIRKILVENATPVQFGQPLFVVDPA